MRTSGTAGVSHARPTASVGFMHIIDRYAYTNRIRKVDPAYKVGFALTVLFLCLLLDEPLVGLLAALWMWLLAVAVAGLPPVTFGRVLFAEAGFLMLVTVGVAISVSAVAPWGETHWAIHAGPIWLSTGPENLNLAAHLVTRALGGAAAMNFMAMTTPLVDMVDLFRRVGVPVILIDVMTLMYRFVFVLMDSLDRMYVAQSSRLGYRSWRRGITSAAELASRLFIDAYQRSEKLQVALDSRAYDGELRVLPAEYQRNDLLLLSAFLVIASMFLAWGIA